ncbi:MAG: glycosyltransferase [Chlorobium sp.]|nr:glycosyltransferase [Chlorobium sp.]
MKYGYIVLLYIEIDAFIQTFCSKFLMEINAPSESVKLQPLCGQQQLFIDISGIIGEDVKTGIQRVVRSIVMELLERPPQEIIVEPVYFEQTEQGINYRYAKEFARHLLSKHEERPLPLLDKPIEIKKGDIFLGLDLCYHVRYARQFFNTFHHAGGRVFFVVYDLLPFLLSHCFPTKSARRHSEWMNMVAEYDGVLCISRAVADDVKKWFYRVQPIRTSPYHIGWFHLGADIEQSLPTKGFPDRFDENLLRLTEATTILMVGTIEPRKGHLLLLKAFEILWLTGTRVNLVIVGKKGWLVEKLAKRMKRHNKFNRSFYWYQGLSDEALIKLYTLADGVVMASEGEGFGLPLIEAAQYGCPILALDLPVFREVAGEHATYFSVNSPLKLSRVLKAWIITLKNGSAPQSTGMNWMSWKESSDQIIKLLTDSNDKNWLYQCEKIGTSKPAEPPIWNGTLRTIAVDLTPIMPDVNYGEYKIFVLELLRMLAKIKPKTSFILLTKESSNKELAFLDRPNMRRMVVLNDSNARENRADNFVMLMMAEWTRFARRWKKGVMKRLNNRNYTSWRMLQDMGVNLLFSPFFSLDFAESGVPRVCSIYDLQYKTHPDFFKPGDDLHHERSFIDGAHSSVLDAISRHLSHSAITHGNLDPSYIRTCYLNIAQEYWELFKDAASRCPVIRSPAWNGWKMENDPAESSLKMSIVTPSFNQCQFIERALLSVARQQVKDIEHIVIDGGSTDGTVDLLTRFKPAVRWISEKNEGQSHAVNKGLQAATGDIIGWLNSNDIYYPSAVRRVTAFFETHPDVDIAYGMADHIDIDDRPFEAYPTEPWDLERLHNSCFICQPALFFRRRVIEQHGLLDESLRYCMDYEYWLRLGRAGLRFAYLDEKLAGSRLYAKNKTAGSRIKVISEINDMFKKKFGKVPEQWLKSYTLASMQRGQERQATSQAEFHLRVAIAKLRWKWLYRN